MVISALSIFRVSNRHTFGTLFHADLSDATHRARHRVLLVETVLRAIAAP